MKVRTGFVSNSSSSSFLIYGIYFEKEELVKDLNLSEDVNSEDIENEINSHMIDVGIMGKGFEVLSGECTIYIGKHPASARDNQTFGNFKESIKKGLASLIGSAWERYKDRVNWHYGEHEW